MTDPYCQADWIDCTVNCDLPAGHQGDHQGTVTWEQSPPSPPFDPEANPGFAAFLQAKYA